MDPTDPNETLTSAQTGKLAELSYIEAHASSLTFSLDGPYGPEGGPFHCIAPADLKTARGHLDEAFRVLRAAIRGEE